MKNILLFIVSIFICNASFGQWTEINFQPNSTLTEVSFPTKNIAYILGKTSGAAIIYKTTNGGQNWSMVYSFPSVFMDYSNLQFMNADTGFITNSFNGTYRTTDGGITWTAINFSASTPLYHVIKITGNLLFHSYSVIDTMYIQKSSDLGASWTIIIQTTKPNVQSGYPIYQFAFSDSLHGALIDPFQLDRMYKTNDGGVTFDTIISFSGDIELLEQFHFQDTLNGYIYGYGGLATQTWNGGIPYPVINLDGMGILPVLDMDFKPGKLYASSYYGKIFYSTNKGQSWLPDPSPINDAIVSIAFADNNNGIAISYNKVFLKSDNITSIENSLFIENQINIYPNPAKDKIQLAYSNIEIENLQLIDLSGKIIKTFSSKSKTLDISGIAAGNYFLEINAKEGKISKQIVVQ